MQSFKSFLKEDQNTSPILLNVKLQGDGYISPTKDNNQLYTLNKIILREIGELCDKANLPKPSIVHHFGTDRVSFGLDLKSNTHYTESDLNKIVNDFIRIVDQYEIYKNDFVLFDIKSPTVVLRDNFDKSTTVEVKEVMVSNNVTTLKDIHKVILSANAIYIDDATNIESNILGILKIKNVSKFFVSTVSSGDSGSWTKIIQKYLTNKNILACQEELMDNGLKHYAKF